MHKQLFLQLKTLILSGDIENGARLPSIRELSSLVNVNRHTITKAYEQLEREGFVETFPATGTFVKGDAVPEEFEIEKLNELNSAFEEVLKSAKEKGFSNEMIINTFYSNLLNYDDKNGITAIFCECNKPASEQYALDIKKETGLDVESAVIDENISLDEINMIKSYDVVLTTLGHYAEFQSILGGINNLYAINFGPYLSVIKQIRECDEETNFVIVCVTKHAAESLAVVLFDFGIAPHRIRSLSLDLFREGEVALAKNDVIVVSKHALNKSENLLSGLSNKVIEYENVLQNTSVLMIEEVINQIKRQRSMLNFN